MERLKSSRSAAISTLTNIVPVHDSLPLRPRPSCIRYLHRARRFNSPYRGPHIQDPLKMVSWVQTTCYIDGQPRDYRNLPNQGFPSACPVSKARTNGIDVCATSFSKQWGTRATSNSEDACSYSSSSWRYVGSRIVGTKDTGSLC